MPNHVTHKIEFNCTPERFAEIAAAISGDGVAFDFERLIPTPAWIYQYGVSGYEDEDFEHCTWLAWSRRNWGTKWNCYQSSFEHVDNRAILQFDTAWSIPYPIVIAFANTFGETFSHKYYDEGANYWGVEDWDAGIRRKRRRSHQDDERSLCIELKGYDPHSEDEDEELDTPETAA